MDSLQNTNLVGYDHNYLSIRVKLQGVVHEVQTIETRAIKNLDPGQFHELWNQIDFHDFWRTNDVDIAVKLYTDSVQACLDYLVPLRKMQIKPDNAPWLTKELLEEIKMRNSMREEAMRTNDDEIWLAFKQLRNRLRIKCDKAKKEHLDNNIQGEDSKKSWRTIMAMSGLASKKSSKIWLKEDGVAIEDPGKVAEHLNDFFVSKVNKIVETHPPNPEEMKKYTEEYITGKKIESLNFKCVDTSMIVIKKLSLILAPFLTRIINLSLLSSKY